MDDHDLTRRLSKVVNDTGFPLQIGVASAVKRELQGSWNVLYEEHAWRSRSGEDEGFIDLVLEKPGQVLVAALECKRVKENSSWLFLNPVRTNQAKAWITTDSSDGNRKVWIDLRLGFDVPQSAFCAVYGADADNPMLERVAGKLITATGALALEESFHLGDALIPYRVYFSVIVTTAQLRICRFDPRDVSLRDGKVPNASFETVPYVAFRKQLSTDPANRPVAGTPRLQMFARAKEHTVFVLNAEELVPFLAQFRLHGAGLIGLVPT